MEAKFKEMRLNGCWAGEQLHRGKRDSLLWAYQVLSPPLGIVSLPTAAQAHQFPTIFVISAKLRSGIPLSMVKTLGFTEASTSLTKVSGVKHPALGRA